MRERLEEKAHPKKTQGEKDHHTPNYSKLTNSNNCFRFVIVIHTLIFIELGLPLFTPVSSSCAPPLQMVSAIGDGRILTAALDH